ncbi:MAG: triose-phosphate isomerase [Candidatus Peribacteraceae bacterium]|jgi:triosephosphate isomerase|nr:triose-phosphate isomerase [bacterium]MDP6561896.1 triose-phosphate isomerase [Candidatus Peribacteraceae bacterium]|tara:strand:+ start:4309 stop:5034 length:726 start_codon:yes stop_codon:yes gene_type:complete
MRKYLIAANWKMNSAPEGAFDPESPYQTHADVDVVVFPTYLDLRDCIEAKILSGPQYGHVEEHGAHTGDVSLKMCKDLGCLYALCGHSDRRGEHGETSEQVAAQVIAALECELHPIVCLGETLKEKKAGKTEDVIKAMMAPLPLESDLTIAYEPVWAISRGDPNTPAATPEDAQQMHALIRSMLPDDRKEQTRILYGGSMKLENAEALLGQIDIDGGLIGGASLKPDQFALIIEAASKLST